MGLLDGVRALLGAGGEAVRLDAAPAGGSADDAVRAAIAEIRSAVALDVRPVSTATYLEAVVELPERDGCVTHLSRVFGAPVKHFGKRASFDAALQAMIDSRGGIHADQCLFLRRYSDERVAFAALWPWGNGVTTTLKVGVYDASFTPSA